MGRDASVGRSFFAGLMVGLGLAGVTVVTIGAERRAARRAAVRAPVTPIDGVRPPGRAELDARPQSEANARPEPLVSEAVDAPTTSQRW